MANFREYSAQLASMGGMRRVTATMKMVAASHLHRAQTELHLPEPFAADAYARAIATTLQHLPQMRAAAAAESRRLLSLQGRWLTVIADTVEQFAAANRQAP